VENGSGEGLLVRFFCMRLNRSEASAGCGVGRSMNEFACDAPTWEALLLRNPGYVTLARPVPLLQAAGTGQFTGRQRLQIFKGHFHGVALHDVFHGQNHAEAVLVAHHNAFKTC